jgi:hypothetical protein
VPNGELENNISLCFQKFGDCIDYIDQDQYYSHLKGAKYIWYNMVAIPVMSFQYKEQVVYMAHRTGSTN